jgi:hypothetical protein
MKTIEGLTENEKKSLVLMLEETTPQTKTTIKDIRQIDKICTVLESPSDGALMLEDADYSYLKQRISEFPGWRPKSRKEIIQLSDKLGI